MTLSVRPYWSYNIFPVTNICLVSSYLLWDKYPIFNRGNFMFHQRLRETPRLRLLNLLRRNPRNKPTSNRVRDARIGHLHTGIRGGNHRILLRGTHGVTMILPEGHPILFLLYTSGAEIEFRDLSAPTHEVTSTRSHSRLDRLRLEYRCTLHRHEILGLSVREDGGLIYTHIYTHGGSGGGPRPHCGA